MKYITLKTDIIKVSPQIPDYMSTELIYVPLNNLKNPQFFVKKNDYVYKQDKLTDSIFSPVSGTVLEIRKAHNFKNQEIPCLVIKNDGKEQCHNEVKYEKNIKKYAKEELTTLLKEFKQETIITKLDGNILVKGFTDEVNVANDIMLLQRKTEIILETIDALSYILKLPFIYLILKDNDASSVKKVLSLVGRYPSIKVKLIPNYYGLEDKENLQNFLNIKEEKINVLKLCELIEIYNILKKGRVTTKKYLTITGKAAKKARVINVKIGTPVKNILMKYGEGISTENLYIANGLMQGKEVNVDALIVTKDLDSLFIEPKVDPEKTLKCLNCGLCLSVCPKGLDLKYIHENPSVVQKYLNKCNNCNLCSYICPAKINLRFKKEGK